MLFGEGTGKLKDGLGARNPLHLEFDRGKAVLFETRMQIFTPLALVGFVSDDMSL